MLQQTPHRRSLVDWEAPHRQVVYSQTGLLTSAAAILMVLLYRPQHTGSCRRRYQPQRPAPVCKASVASYDMVAFKRDIFLQLRVLRGRRHAYSARWYQRTASALAAKKG